MFGCAGCVICYMTNFLWMGLASILSTFWHIFVGTLSVPVLGAIAIFVGALYLLFQKYKPTPKAVKTE